MICIGDLHGRYDILEAAMTAFPNERLLCVGDYVDSHDLDVPSQLRTLKLALSLAGEGHVMLMGNHEVAYLFSGMECSGMTYAMQAHIEPLKSQMLAKLRPFYIDKKLGILFTHAGLSAKLVPEGVEDLGKLEEYLSEEWGLFQGSRAGIFAKIGVRRGGYSHVGGPLWCDYRSELEETPVGITQVFGHTHTRGWLVKGPSWFNLDCLDTAEELLRIDESTGEIEVLRDWKDGYSDEQFEADIEKAGKVLDNMERQALEEHARGETREFP